MLLEGKSKEQIRTSKQEWEIPGFTFLSLSFLGFLIQITGCILHPHGIIWKLHRADLESHRMFSEVLYHMSYGKNIFQHVVLFYSF